MKNINHVRTSKEIAALAAVLIKHPDPRIRAVAAVALANRKEAT